MRGGGAFFFLGTPAEAANQLSLGNPPLGWHVHDGESGTVGTIQATGLRKKSVKKRIRYSVSGNSAFSIDIRSGVVSYDGTPQVSSPVSLSISARVIRSSGYTPATITVSVAVEGIQAQEQEAVPLDPNAVLTSASTRPVARDPDTFTEAERKQCLAFFGRGGAGDSDDVPDHCRELDISDVEVGPPKTHTHDCTHPATTNYTQRTHRNEEVKLTSTPYDGRSFRYKHTHVVYPRRNADSPVHEKYCPSAADMQYPTGGPGEWTWSDAEYGRTARAKYMIRWAWQLQCNRANAPAWCAGGPKFADD